MHFVGIGGAGMSGIAKILLEMGHQVSGSDLSVSPRTERLQLLGGRIFLGHKAAHVEGSDIVVVSTAIRPDNPEVAAARMAGIPIRSRAWMLGRLMQDRHGIAVSGTHGKTTTTSMIALMLVAAGKSPTFVIGGELNDIGTNAKLGTGPYVVAEADESDASFLELTPRIAVITNVEADHLEHYGGMDHIRVAFRSFLDRLPPDGLAVLCADDPGALALAAAVPCPYLTYGLDANADYRAVDVVSSDFGVQAQVYCGERDLGVISPKVPGVHNMVNALAAVAVGDAVGLSAADIASGLAQFSGAERRFEKLGEVSDVLVVDDYAHHPTEIRVTLAAAMGLNRRVIAVFQPHRYTRTMHLGREFATAFAQADLVVLTDIYAAHEEPIPGVDLESLARDVREHHKHVVVVPDKREIPQALASLVRPGDVVLTMGAGDIRQAGEEFLAQVARGAPSSHNGSSRLRVSGR